MAQCHQSLTLWRVFGYLSREKRKGQKLLVDVVEAAWKSSPVAVRSIFIEEVDRQVDYILLHTGHVSVIVGVQLNEVGFPDARRVIFAPFLRYSGHCVAPREP